MRCIFLYKRRPLQLAASLLTFANIQLRRQATKLPLNNKRCMLRPMFELGKIANPDCGTADSYRPLLAGLEISSGRFCILLGEQA
jgi:hypothetical protein